GGGKAVGAVRRRRIARGGDRDGGGDPVRPADRGRVAGANSGPPAGGEGGRRGSEGGEGRRADPQVPGGRQRSRCSPGRRDQSPPRGRRGGRGGGTGGQRPRRDRGPRDLAAHRRAEHDDRRHAAII
ncbi:MAG: hypothetical protein AVDCRST_MAG73-3907, partial [uncultured Thermomicrobiales bacterium]